MVVSPGQYMQNVPQPLILATRDEMIAEAKAIVDAARARGLVLRLLGGLAARLHCRSLDFCERDHGDVDLIGHRRDSRRIADLLAGLGYREDLHVLQATGGRQLQFRRPCRHGANWAQYQPHDEDHVDVFLDTFKMDHAIDLSERLHLDDYTISPTDVLLIKLQMARLEEKDERDAFTLLSDLELSEVKTESGGAEGGGTADQPGAGAVDVSYIARLCGENWGLYHDVVTNLANLQSRLGEYGVGPPVEDKVRAALARLEGAVEGEPKSTAWRLRAKVGTHLPWRNLVEEQEG
jgi:hypothetical protein